MNHKVLAFAIIVFMISLVAAFGIDNNRIPRLARAVVNTNNTAYFDGYTPNTLGDYYQSTRGWGNATVSGDINMGTNTISFGEVGALIKQKAFGENTLLITGDNAPNINFGFAGMVYSTSGNTDLGTTDTRWRTLYAKNVDVLGNITGNSYYGEMKNWTDGGYTATPIGVAVYHNVTNLKAGLNNGFIVINRAGNLGGTALQPQYSGVYKITAKITIQITSGGLYGFGVVVNSVNPEITGDCYSRKQGDGNWDTIPIDCFYGLNAGDNLTLVYDDEANPVKALSIEKVEVNALRIGN